MRFRFLGDGDCPDWLLAVINTLSRMNSMKLKQLGDLVVKSIVEGELEEEKVKKIAQDGKYDNGEIKAIVAALETILTSSARHNASPADLSSELQQLGLPREHSSAISRIHTDNCSQITTALTAKTLRLNRLSSIEVSPCEGSSIPKLSLKIKTVGSKDEETTLNIEKSDVKALIAELKKARAAMEGL